MEFYIEPMLCAIFIDELPKTNEKEIDNFLFQISQEIREQAKLIGITKARQNANIKYGKFWRERLCSKKIYNNHN